MSSGVFGKLSSAVSKQASAAKAAWNDPNSGFKSSKYGQQYQQALDAYNQKRADYLKKRGWAENSLAQGSGLFYEVTKGEGTDNGAYTERVQISRARALSLAIGSAPSISTYYKSWTDAGSPSYKEATDTKTDNGTQDNPAPEQSASDSNVTVKKDYDIQGSSARGHGYAPSRSDDSGEGEGGTGQRTGDSGDGLGTGTPSGEKLKKQFKPLGK